MCVEETVKRCLYALTLAPNKYKTQQILRHDWFVTPKMLEDNNLDLSDFCKLFTWYNKYNQSKAYKKRYTKS